MLTTASFLQAKVYDNNTIHSINITLVNVSRDDNNFLLTCTATNVVGMTNASVQLTVHCEYTRSKHEGGLFLRQTVVYIPFNGHSR